MKILLLAASVRKDSFNKKLIKIVASLLQKKSVALEELTEKDLLLPLYDGDFEAAQGLPLPAKNLVEKFRQADALVIATPEYNFSIPGTLKNMLDWVSRARPMPFWGLPIFLLSASPSLVGGNRGLLQVRIPLEACGAHVFPQSFALAQADQAFDEKQQLKDVNLQQQLEKTTNQFLDFVGKLKNKF